MTHPDPAHPKPLSRFEAQVLHVMQRDPGRWWYARDINTACGRQHWRLPGVYPPLAHLKRQGLIRWRQETEEEQGHNEHKRMLWQVTAEGRWTRVAEPAPSFLDRLRQVFRPPGSAAPSPTK